MKFILSAVVSSDGFIADHHGNVNFASKEDKALLKNLMVANTSDCFIMGRKTYQKVQGKIKKPYIILSHNHRNYKNSDNRIFTDFLHLIPTLNSLSLKQPIVLGGAEIYSQFFQSAFNLEVRLTVERNVTLGQGIKFYNLEKYLDDKNLIKEQILSDNTTLLTYKYNY